MADRILIVDDDPAICKLLERVMRSNELEAVTASSGAQALEYLEQQVFDVILLDVNLGDMEGFEVLRRLRERGIPHPGHDRQRAQRGLRLPVRPVSGGGRLCDQAVSPSGAGGQGEGPHPAQPGGDGGPGHPAAVRL